MKTFFNIVKVIMAAFLSIFLFSTLIGAVAGFSASSFLQEDVLAQLFAQIDYAEIVEENVDLSEQLQQAGIDAEAVGKLMNSEAMDEIIELYFDDIFRVIENSGEITTFTSEGITKIVNEHMEELMPIAEELLQEVENKDPELLQQQVQMFMENVAESLPTPEDLGMMGPNMTEENKEVLYVLQSLNSGMIVIPFVILAVLFSLGIVLCRLEKFKGFIWLAVVYFLSGGLTLGLGNVLHSSKYPVSSVNAELELLLVEVIEAFGGKMMFASLLVILVAVICLIVAVLGRKVKSVKSTEELMME